MSPSPTLLFCVKISRQVHEVLLFFEYLDHTRFLRNFRKFLKTSNVVTQVDKFVLEFCGLDPLGILALVDTATLNCFNHAFFYEFSHEPLALLSGRFYRKKVSSICVKEKNFEQCHTHSLDRNRHYLS
jgi:hypothetical protein